jgi:hypothetical protein
MGGLAPVPRVKGTTLCGPSAQRFGDARISKTSWGACINSSPVKDAGGSSGSVIAACTFRPYFNENWRSILSGKKVKGRRELPDEWNKSIFAGNVVAGLVWMQENGRASVCNIERSVYSADPPASQ